MNFDKFFEILDWDPEPEEEDEFEKDIDDLMNHLKALYTKRQDKINAVVQETKMKNRAEASSKETYTAPPAPEMKNGNPYRVDKDKRLSDMMMTNSLENFKSPTYNRTKSYPDSFSTDTANCNSVHNEDRATRSDENFSKHHEPFETTAKDKTNMDICNGDCAHCGAGHADAVDNSKEENPVERAAEMSLKLSSNESVRVFVRTLINERAPEVGKLLCAMTGIEDYAEMVDTVFCDTFIETLLTSVNDMCAFYNTLIEHFGIETVEQMMMKQNKGFMF